MSLYYHLSCVAHICKHVCMCECRCRCIQRPKVDGRNIPPSLSHIIIEAVPLNQMQSSQPQLIFIANLFSGSLPLCFLEFGFTGKQPRLLSILFMILGT